jgi:hypothetical protein
VVSTCMRLRRAVVSACMRLQPRLRRLHLGLPFLLHLVEQRRLVWGQCRRGWNRRGWKFPSQDHIRQPCRTDLVLLPDLVLCWRRPCIMVPLSSLDLPVSPLISLMIPGLMPPRLIRAHHSAWLCRRLWRRRVQGWRLPLPLPRLLRLRRLLLATTTAAAARGRTWRHGR